MPLSHKDDDACNTYNQEILCEDFSWYPCQLVRLMVQRMLKKENAGWFQVLSNTFSWRKTKTEISEMVEEGINSGTPIFFARKFYMLK